MRVLADFIRSIRIPVPYLPLPSTILSEKVTYLDKKR